MSPVQYKTHSQAILLNFFVQLFGALHLYIGLIMDLIGTVGMVFAPLIYKVIFTKSKNENATDVLFLAQEIIMEDEFRQ